jgi:hypothetical protein
MQHNDDPRHDDEKRALLVPLVVAAVVLAFLVLHLTGVFGP